MFKEPCWTKNVHVFGTGKSRVAWAIKLHVEIDRNYPLKSVCVCVCVCVCACVCISGESGDAGADGHVLLYSPALHWGHWGGQAGSSLVEWADGESVLLCVRVSLSTEIMCAVKGKKHFNWKSWAYVPLCCWLPVSWLCFLPVHHSWSGRHHLGQKLHYEDCESIEYTYTHMQQNNVCQTSLCYWRVLLIKIIFTDEHHLRFLKHELKL